jgi:hypothetical protein
MTFHFFYVSSKRMNYILFHLSCSIYAGPRANTDGEQSNDTNSSTNKEYMNNDIYEVQSSTGSNSVDMGLVNYPESEDGETVEKCPNADQDPEVGTSPSN